MILKFIESLSGKLAERWVANVLAPAFVFCFGGFCLRALRFGWTGTVDGFMALEGYEQLAVVSVGLIAIGILGNIIQQFDLVTLHFLSGDWPLVLKPLAQGLQQRHVQRRQNLRDRFEKLDGMPIPQLTSRQREERLELDWQLMHIPIQSNQIMPTRLGNILRSAELKSRDRYGLDAVVCLPRLWLLLSDAVKKELETARDNLSAAMRIWLWCVLFMIWAIWAWWAVLVGLGAAVFVYYWWVIPAAAIYADLLEATFDLYRLELYKALRWPLPTTPADEKPMGSQLTEYLWRGSDAPKPTFVVPPSD